MKEIPRHNSIRGEFAYQLYRQMEKRNDIWVVTGDLGYAMLDRIKEDFPDRFINTGAAEQTMMGIAVGLAREKQIPFVYSITPFLLCRPYETIRNYVDHEKIPVRLVGSGRDDDYKHDGFSHHAFDDKQILGNFPNIHGLWPSTKEEIEANVDVMLRYNRPWYINLKR